MTYELLKYRYGNRGDYTAFCLTPALKQPKAEFRFGKERVYTNEGSYSSRCRHFQTPQAAAAWMASIRGQLLNPDWTPIQGTGIYGNSAPKDGHASR